MGAEAWWRSSWRDLALFVAVFAANGVVALTTVLDPSGFPLVQPAFAPTDGGDTKKGGDLRGVDLIYLGSYHVRSSSAEIRPSSVSRSVVDTHVQALAAATIESLNDGGGGGGIAPLLLLDGHVCALASGTKAVNSTSGGLVLETPYEWESDQGASAYLLPPWMWHAVAGDMGGGALLMHANTPSIEEQGAPGAGGVPSATDTLVTVAPFVQLASWGQGKFSPFMKVTSTGLSFDGENGDASDGVTRSRHEIRTGAGGLEIVPAADLYLMSGEAGGEVRIGTRGEHGCIHLSSDAFHWTSTSVVNSNSASTATEGHQSTSISAGATETGVNGGTVERGGAVSEASLRMNADSFEAKGSASFRFAAGQSFDLAVVEEREGIRVETPTAASVKGDSHAVNISGGTVNVEAFTDLLIAGANGTTIRSDTGDVLLDSSRGGSSFLLESSAIRGAARTVAFSAGVMPGLGQRGFTAPLDATGAFGVGGIKEETKGGYVNLTEEAATLGGPGDASIRADDEVCLEATNSSLLRVSTTLISLQTPVILLRSSATPSRSEASNDHLRPLEFSPGNIPEDGARLRLGGGSVGINASASVECQTPGASVRLVGRGSKSDDGVTGGVDTRGGVLGSEEGGIFVADADAVEIRARSATGVTIVADCPSTEETAGGAGDHTGSGGSRTGGGRLEVSAQGVYFGGGSVTNISSPRVTLRAEAQGGQGGEASAQPGSTMPPKEGEGPSIELSKSGIQVMTGSSESILLHAGSRVVLETPQLAITHRDGMGVSSKTASGNGHGISSGSDSRGGGGGGGLWSDGLALTGRADRRVLFQAGVPDREVNQAVSGNRSHISIEESLIRVCVGTGEVKEVAAVGSGAAGADAVEGCDGDGSATGLFVEVIGKTNLSSTESLQIRGGELTFSSSNQTRLHSPGGLLLTATSPLGGSGGTTSTNIRSAQLDSGKRPDGRILLAPGVGSGVGIGSVFSSQDLSASSGTVPSLLYVTNSTGPAGQRLLPPPDAHIAVESSGDSAIAVLSPRGTQSAVRFGCSGMPYSGGLAVRHDRDGHAGDTLVLELASSPGRVVGDAFGRWGVGAVRQTGPSAALHVFASADIGQSFGKESASAAAGTETAAALLVESTGPAVIQLLGGGSSSSPRTAMENAIVLTSGPPEATPRHGKHRHWVMSQLREDVTRPPAWTDASVDRLSWAGGMTLTHVFGEGPTGWRPALRLAEIPTPETESGATAARPAVAFGANGRSGFGTGSTGARVTIGGVLLAEQVLVLSDEGMVRDIEPLNDHGREQAMEAIRRVDVVSYGWTKESSTSYGLQVDARQIGTIAQQVEKASPSLVWKDVATGRKAVSYSRLLATLVAAFQHLDASVQATGRTRDDRLEVLEGAATASDESDARLFERLEILETTAEKGLASLMEQGRSVGALEGRLVEHQDYVEVLAATAMKVQGRAAEEKGETQIWRRERTRREVKLEEEVHELTLRLNEMVEQRRIAKEEKDARRKATDNQIQALSLRIGSSQSSQSKGESSLRDEMEALRKDHEALEDRLSALHLHPQAVPWNEEAFFVDEVRRLEDNLRQELRHEKKRAAADNTRLAQDDAGRAGRSTVTDAEVRQHLDKNKENVRMEAMSAVLRHREHLRALRGMGR